MWLHGGWQVGQIKIGRLKQWITGKSVPVFIWTAWLVADSAKITGCHGLCPQVPCFRTLCARTRRATRSNAMVPQEVENLSLGGQRDCISHTKPPSAHPEA
ncbi:hypothetical protein FOPG_02171 [Fusarium oxysporum f. sp. conglutinans race 2 54008]|nr:hypothetical protein FOPG_02171 [Fusarium oxysporum f. sp. conglutinans race 2 54008]KAJ0155351.1 Ras-like protein 1 [Fusarium oxysporum f. sp. albedinis]